MMTHVFIGLGSNQNAPEKQLQTALSQLEAHPDIQALSTSSFYRSKPIGPVKQPDFINAVARFETKIQPEPLLALLQSIENTQGRTRTVHWGPRPLDLDILLYGKHIISSENLTVPHPHMKERAFVLKPLAELCCDLALPDGSLVCQLLDNLPEKDLNETIAIPGVNI